MKTLFIEPGSPWENGDCESFDSKLRDELLNGEIFTTLREAQVLIESWRRHYNAVRPHSSLGCRPPAPEAILPPARDSRTVSPQGAGQSYQRVTDPPIELLCYSRVGLLVVDDQVDEVELA